MTARILIIDDVPANTRLLEAKLAAEYYKVATSPDGLESVRVAVAWQPDLVVLGAGMSDSDAVDICRRLKADEATMHIPVVIISGSGDAGARRRGLEAGADDVLTTPVDPDILLARLRSLARLKRVLDELRTRGANARTLRLSGEGSSPPSIAGARALVVDDWDEHALALQGALAQDGIVSGRAGTADEATALTAAIPFDLIVLSLSNLADDPLRLAAQLRATDAMHDIPLLLVAEPRQRERILRGFDLGATDWVLRPIDDDELRARARNQIRRKLYRDRLRVDLGHALDMALTDSLTGFYNPRYLMRHLAALLASPETKGLAVLMVDIDHFKTVNDRWGHAVGDTALQAVAEVLRARTRVVDSIVRYGGEEFVVLIPGASPQEAHSAADRLRNAISRMSFEPEPGSPFALTVSIGVSFCNSPNMTAERLVRSAEAAMNSAKRGGRNRVELAPPT